MRRSKLNRRRRSELIKEFQTNQSNMNKLKFSKNGSVSHNAFCSFPKMNSTVQIQDKFYKNPDYEKNHKMTNRVIKKSKSEQLLKIKGFKNINKWHPILN